MGSGQKCVLTQRDCLATPKGNQCEMSDDGRPEWRRSVRSLSRTGDSTRSSL